MTATRSFSAEYWSGCAWTLLDGPSLYQTLYTRVVTPRPRLEGQRQRQQSWPDRFRELRAAAEKGLDVAGAAAQLNTEISQQLNWEEQHLHPAVAHFLKGERAMRQLGYEHTGIRRYLPQLQAALAGDERNWQRFAIDLVHLVEHHLEHETRGAYPIYERLTDEAVGAK